MIIPECEACPFKLWPGPCHAAVAGVRRYCTLIHEMKRADYREMIERRTLGLTDSPPNPSVNTGWEKCCGQAKS